jgi:hypothetical protein
MFQPHRLPLAVHCLIRRVTLIANRLTSRHHRKGWCRCGFAKLEHGEQHGRFLSFGKAQQLSAMLLVQALVESHLG